MTEPSIFAEDYPGNACYDDWSAYLRRKRPDPAYPEDSDDGL